MKINCLSCGFKVDLSDAYDDYEGQVKCYACGAILEIKTQEGNVRAVKSVGATLEIETQEGNVRAVKSVKVVPSPPVEGRKGRRGL
jgi:DNA-directed RNA polymerase subunit N (RpoN/RPB10)